MTGRDTKLELLTLLFVYGSAKKPPTRADIRKALLPLLKAQDSDAEAKRRIDAAVDGCVAEVDIEEVRGARRTAVRFRATPGGAKRLEGEFGKIDSASWPALRDRYVVRRALAGGTEPPSNLGSYAALRAFLALRASGIEYRAGISDAAALDRIAAKAAGSPRADKTAIRTALVRSWLRTNNPPTVNAPPAANAPPEANAPVANAPAASAPPEASDPPEANTVPAANTGSNATESTFDLVQFASSVNAAARSAASGRWGTNKVFVNHVWRQLSSATPAALDLARFKARLLEANRAGLVRLSRADLVISLPQDDVRESEISTIGDDVFHFVNI